MTHKIAVLKAGYNYTGTDVPFERSVGQIQAMLMKHGCDRIGILTDRKGEHVLTSIMFEKAGIPYLIEFPVTYIQQKTQKKLEMKVSGRIIHDRIKALLIDVDINILDFSQAMMGFIALPGPGGPVTLQEIVLTDRDRIAQGSFKIEYTALPKGVEEEP
ncbi:MAG: hypothetical protein PHT07_23115 [Paludibacter sp.]|nr:hypothetical protein [Paludibacter sp.]